MATHKKAQNAKIPRASANIVWFEVPADDLTEPNS